MGLSEAHKGYEYQDLFSAFHIVSILLTYNEATFKIDRKETANDKFDDFTIITDSSIIKRQIKYSESKVLEKSDLSSEKYDLALDVLFKSWMELPKDKIVDIRLCLAWKYLEDCKELNFLAEIHTDDLYQDNGVKTLKIDLESIWPLGSEPISSWKRLKGKSSEINRDDFAKFINDLVIEVNLPKSSADLTNAGPLEKLLLEKLRLFGVGKYPNDNKTATDVAMHLMHIIKRARAKGEELRLSKIIYELGLMRSYGNIEQEFKINRDINVFNIGKYYAFKEFLFKNNKVSLLGEPGSGKSWFIQNFIQFLQEHNINIIRHYCYTGINDIYEQERITTNIFLANLIDDIIKSMPYLEQYKDSRYGVDFDELQSLISHIQEDVVIIVDGLDHIGRIYNLHIEAMKKIDTKIIETISQLKFPSNVKVIVASQPINEVIQLSNSSFKEYIVTAWDINEVKLFMDNNQLIDVRIDYHCMLSDLLLEKSSGNPLYLTYLVNELSKYTQVVITRDLIETFPPYNNNLENYYTFMMTKLSEDQRVPQILAGSPFPLTEDELKDITYLGKYVTESLNVIRSILSYNACSGGYIIYHESFRRYILELLQKNEVRIEEAIYSPLIEWLKKRGFYKDRKSYLNLMCLLFESKRYEEILKYCSKDFVVNTVYYGNNILSLKKNFSFLIKAACKTKNYGALIKCTELNNMIYSFAESFIENSKYYYLALGLINGFDSLKNMLIYEGKNALTYNQGMQVCYLCSQNNVIPEWNAYIKMFLDAKRKSDEEEYLDYSDELEEYKYFICACLDTNRDMIHYITKVANKDLADYRQIIIDEYSRRGRIEELQELIIQIQNQENWINSINIFLGKKVINSQDINTVFERLRQSDSHSEETLLALKYYFYNIDWIISNHSKILYEFINTIQDRNWYYNWLIFIYKVNIIFHINKTEIVDDIRLIEAYSWLTKDLDCFKGKPRTCDLHRYEAIIFESIKQPLQYVNNESTWYSILNIIEMMSRETMTSLSGSIGGPLPTYKLFDLLIEIANETNIKVISDIFKQRIDCEGKHRLYSYLADYSFKYAIILSKGKKMSEAANEFKEGVKYLLAYSFRKDRTLSHLLDSVNSICKIDKNIGLECIMQLKPLADAVIQHTDGKSTKTYQKEWFEVLTKHNKHIALTYITQELLNYNNYWILEESFDYLLEVMNSEINPVVENILFKTRPNNVNANFIRSYLNNISALISSKEIYLARQSMLELLSRFPKGVCKDDYNRIYELCKILDLDIKIQVKPETNFNSRNSNGISNYKKHEQYTRNISLDKMSYQEILEYIMNYGLKESEIQGLYYYIQSIHELNVKSKMFIGNLIKHTYDRRRNDKTRERILLVIDNLSVSSEVMAFIHISIFMNHRDGWYQRLTETHHFIKAIQFNKEVAEQYFFDYFYYNMSSVDYSLSVGHEIINALVGIGFEGSEIIQYWKSLFEIINFRLPDQYEYNWDKIIELSKELNPTEKVISLLLTRLKYAESNRYKWIIAGLDKIFQSPKYRLDFIKPFKYYLKNHQVFIEYSLVILLYLILKWFNEDELLQDNLRDNILSIYPTSNNVIDYLIRKITGKKKQRIYTKYISNYTNNDDELSYWTKILKQADNRIELLEKQGVNISNIVQAYIKEVFNEDTVSELRDILYDRAYSVIVSNIYFYDILMKKIGGEIESFISQYVGTPFIDIVEEDIYEIVLDNLNYIISTQNSIIPRPSDIKLPSKINNSIEDVKSNEWIRLAYYERWYNKRKKYKDNCSETMDSTLVISGIEFKGNQDIAPVLSLRKDYNIFDENYEAYLYDRISAIPSVTMTDIKRNEDLYLSFKDNIYLGLRVDIFNLLELKLINKEDGIFGVDKTGEIILKYSRWEVCFDDIDTGSYRIPYLIGAELKIKEKAFKQICQLFNTKPQLYTVKLE